MEFSYKFSTVKGTQANENYYISMVSLKYLSKLFKEDVDVPLPEYRSQRRINEYRIPDIKKYILENRNNYVFSALAASIDGNFNFKPITQRQESIGIIEIDMDAKLLINDGQHRLAAIKEAIMADPTLNNETISIVFFKDDGLEKSQQMFTDLNKHAVKTSNSLSTLYDNRDVLAVATKEIIKNNSFLNMFTDKEKDNLGKNSSKLFTLNSLYKANSKILKGNNCKDSDREFMRKFWDNLVDNITEWNELKNKTITKKDLRENYIITLGVTLNAFGKLGAFFYSNPQIEMERYLKKLKDIDWLRSDSKNWLYRTINEKGKVKNNDEAIFLTYLKIKELIGLKLTSDEIKKESTLLKKVQQ